MKKIVLFFMAFVCVNLIVIAQAPQIDGIWKSSSGNQFQVEKNNLGFLYKNTQNEFVIQAYFIGNNFGVPSYRADFTDGSFQLYMVQSSNKITTSNSYDPNTIGTWVKIKSSSQDQNQNNNKQYNGNFNNSSSSGKQCGVCKGSGWSNSVVWAPNYTGEPVEDVWCEICKAYRKPHTHKPCYSCGGTGQK